MEGISRRSDGNIANLNAHCLIEAIWKVSIVKGYTYRARGRKGLSASMTTS